LQGKFYSKVVDFWAIPANLNGKNHHMSFFSPTTQTSASERLFQRRQIPIATATGFKSTKEAGFLSILYCFFLREGQANFIRTPPLATYVMNTFGSFGRSDPTVSTCLRQAAHNG